MAFAEARPIRAIFYRLCSRKAQNWFGPRADGRGHRMVEGISMHRHGAHLMALECMRSVQSF